MESSDRSPGKGSGPLVHGLVCLRLGHCQSLCSLDPHWANCIQKLCYPASQSPQTEVLLCPFYRSGGRGNLLKVTLKTQVNGIVQILSSLNPFALLPPRIRCINRRGG